MQLQGRELRINMRGDDVTVLHDELARLGHEIAASERALTTFGESTRAAVVAFQSARGIEPTGIVDQTTAARMGVAIDELGEQTAPYRVSGRVFTSDRAALPGMRVVAVDRCVGGEMPLGETVADERGGYAISYTPARPADDRTAKPDIQIKVVARDADRALATSDIRYNARPKETINIVVPVEALARPDEYRRIKDELTPHLGTACAMQTGVRRLADLEESDVRQDVTYLANKTGWDARMVAMVAMADQFGERSGIRPELYYALFRAGFPANDDVLCRVTVDTVEAVWQTAIAGKIVASDLRPAIPESLERFKAASVEHLLEQQAQVGVSSLDELLSLSLGADGARKQRFARISYEARGDTAALWSRVRDEFGSDRTRRLRLDGKLALLTLNNGDVIARLHDAMALLDPVDLVRNGFYKRESWRAILAEVTALPAEGQGDNADAQRANYADAMANQLRLSYPTAVVAEMVKAGDIPITADDGVKAAVYEFLSSHQGQFELGVQPVEQYLRQRALTLSGAALQQVKRLQRVYQITTSDEALGRLLRHNIDSAYAVVRYSERDFVARFKDELGGEGMARLIYAKAHQVHNVVVNVAQTYLLQRTGAVPYSMAIAGMPDSPPAGGISPAVGDEPAPAEETGVLPSATLEQLFGEMDYCACEHCRSVLSPAAYLVDLLEFLDLRKFNDKGEELPSGLAVTPLDVLLDRRPDIQHLRLTCENTNTVLPYVDLVNEILEHFVVNGASMTGFRGFNVGEELTTAELLANPQFVNHTAYAQLRAEIFPPPLPFHQPLAAIRGYFEQFELPLHVAMERLRKDDSLVVPDASDATAYAWRDILIEQLQMSRQEYTLLTDSSIPLQNLYGQDTGIELEPFIQGIPSGKPGLSSVTHFTRTVGISYEELAEIVRTQFINPHAHLLPKLERLGLPIVVLAELINGDLSAEEFSALLPGDLDTSAYGDDVAQWVIENGARIMGLIVLSNTGKGDDPCSMDGVELRYASPDLENHLEVSDFLKLLRFIRLWKKLGWTIEQTDKAIAALYPPAQKSAPGDDETAIREKLDQGLGETVLRISHLTRIMSLLGLKPKRELLGLLACWSPIDTHGRNSLYRQMFLSPAFLRMDEADDIFGENAFGEVLADTSAMLLEHTGALQAAFNVNRDELDLIVSELAFDEQTPLTLEHVSRVFRHAYLARKLKLSVRELIALKKLSGLDPFLPLVPVLPDALRFVQLAQLVAQSGLKIPQVMYFLEHEDLSGKASPSTDSVLAFARMLRTDLLRIDREHVIQEDPTGEIARTKMALVYGNEVADTFFGLLRKSSLHTVTYTHPTPALEPAIASVSDRLEYDDLRKLLSFRGVMSEPLRLALVAVPGVSAAFQQAVAALFAASQVFFERFPDLKTLYEQYESSSQPEEAKLAALLADFLPALRHKLKRIQIRQTVSAQVGAELARATLLLETPTILHADGQPGEAAIADFSELEVRGVSARLFFAEDVTGVPDQEIPSFPGLVFGPGGVTLPADPANQSAPISGVWRWYLEVPDGGFYNLTIDVNAGADVALAIDGVAIAMAPQSGTWQNQGAIELAAGRLYDVELVVKKVKDALVVKWQSKGVARESIPPAYLYPYDLVERFSATYLRLLKSLAIADDIGLSTEDVRFFGAASDYRIAGEGWANALSVKPATDAAVTQALLAVIAAMLRYVRLKRELRVRDDALVTVLGDPTATTESGESVLGLVTGWDADSIATFITHFGIAGTALARLDDLLRVKEAFGVAKTLGVPASAALAATTNEPGPDTVLDLQRAVRARYDDAAWLRVVQPLNDALRVRQRDALVASVLHRLARQEVTQHIDTTERLFEYFLIDVAMDACMQTSRVKQAISSTQLFVQRCLLNLESGVDPSTLDAKMWQWMQRYRVWEANRKVFLFPENWLEPELRDDKSPFFKELESELLQSDITEDSAATALGHYLDKLEQVAKLEICGMYFEENTVDKPADNIVHVIARTPGDGSSYYYRRQEYDAYWTPWEKVDVDIDSNPVLPVVWRGRLFLFWLRDSYDAKMNPDLPAGNEENVASVPAPNLAGAADVDVTLTLYWSERYNGKWQPPRTSDTRHPIALDTFAPQTFDHAKLMLTSSIGSSGELVIWIDYPDKNGTFVRLYNTHSLPVRAGDDLPAAGGSIELAPSTTMSRRFMPAFQMQLLGQSAASQPPAFFIIYSVLPATDIGQPPFSHRLLSHTSRLSQIVAPLHRTKDVVETPFFFQDRSHVFFVQPVVGQATIPLFEGFGLQPFFFDIPESIAILPLIVKKDSSFAFSGDPVAYPADQMGPVAMDPGPVEFLLGGGSAITQAIYGGGTFAFNGMLLGPAGVTAKLKP